jgi:hypothetical protein
MWKSKKLYRIKELIYPLLKNQPSLDQKQANSLEMLSLIEIWNKAKEFQHLRSNQILCKLKLVCSQIGHSPQLQITNL